MKDQLCFDWPQSISPLNTPTDCEEQLVSISWEPPAVSLCWRLSAEEEGFTEQKGHHHSGILLLGSLDSSLGTRPTLTGLIKQIHPGTGSETRALLHSVVSSIFRHIAERTKSVLSPLLCAHLLHSVQQMKTFFFLTRLWPVDLCCLASYLIRQNVLLKWRDAVVVDAIMIWTSSLQALLFSHLFIS